MRVINIFFVSLVLANSRSIPAMAIIKNLVSEPESSQNWSETTQTPEVTNVRSKNPEADLLNDKAKPQLPTDLKEPLSLLQIMAKARRCARNNVARPAGDVIVSLARRDVNARRLQSCKICMKTNVCKRYGMCQSCKIFCDGVTTTTPSTVEEIDNNISTIHGIDAAQTVAVTETAASPEKVMMSSRFKEEEEEITPPSTPVEAVVSSRFQEITEEVSPRRYYSLATVEPGLVMRLLSRIFTIPDSFDRLVILGKKKEVTDKETTNSIVITDLAQAFGKDRKIIANVQRPEGIRMDLVEKLDRRIGEAIDEKGELDKTSMNNIIQEVIEEGSVGEALKTTISPETATRCNLDEAVEDLIDIIPAQRNKPEPTLQPEPSQQPEQSEESSEEKIKNPPVIQDTLNNVGNEENVIRGTRISEDATQTNIEDNKEATLAEPEGKTFLEEDYVDDNEEARPSIISEFKVPRPKPVLQDAKRIIPKEIDPSLNTLGESIKEEVYNVPDTARSIPPSDNQINDPNLKEPSNVAEASPQSRSEDLEKNVLQVVKDSLKTVPTAQNIIETVDKGLQANNNREYESFGPIREEEPELQLTEEKVKPSQANSDNVIKVFKAPTIVESSNPEQESFAPVREEEPELILSEDKLKPSQANSDNVIRVFKAPSRNTVGEPMQTEQPLTNLETVPTTVPHLNPSNFDDPNSLPTVTEVQNLVEMAPRGQFIDLENSKEKSSYFGSLVPTKDGSVYPDPRVKKVLYVGQDINLPLKMFQDENGVMKLRVDTDALCNCKSKNCTRPHLDDRKVDAEVHAELPELKVRYGDDDLMDSFVDSIHRNGEISEVFKRSPRIDNSEKEDKQYPIDRRDKVENMLENKIEKLKQDFNKVNEENIELLNKGTVALYKDIEKTKDVDKMITLANNLLMWMKDFATEHLKS